MSKNIKGVIPKWRFESFDSYPKWDIKKLGCLMGPINERAGDKKYVLMSVTSGVGLIPQVEKFGREIAGNSYKNYYVIRKNDFAYNKSSTKEFPEGYISMLKEYEEAAIPNSIFTCFRVIDDEYEPLFFEQLFNTNYHGKWLKKYIEIGARAHGALSIDTKHLWNMPVAVPKLPEQQKIADGLSSIDDLISAEEKKLSLLNDYKKGWIQKLFPAEGKTVPEWRFPEFMNSGDWEENSLKKVLIKNSMKNKNQKYSLIESISNKFGFVRQDKYFENRRVASKNTSNYYVIKKGYFAYNPSRIDVGSLAYKYDDRTSIISPLYVSFKANNDVIDDIFLWMFFNSISFTKQMIFEGGVRNTLNYENLIQIKIFLPNLPEQQKIAGFLSGIDDLINKQTGKIEMLKQHKKALMQGLFPAVEDVL
jgi:restriction modification system specificity subunit